MLSASRWIGSAPSFLGLLHGEKARIANDDCVLANRLNVLHWQEPAATQVADHAPADLVAPHLTPLVHENVTHLPDLLALLGDYLGTGDRLTLLVQLGDLEVFPQLVERLFTPDHNYITHARHRSPAQCSTMPNHAANQQRHDIE